MLVQDLVAFTTNNVILLTSTFSCGHGIKVMRIVEALEGKGFRLPLSKGEVELAEKLAAITRQVGVPCFLPFFHAFYFSL